MPRLLEHVREGRMDARGLISHRLSLNDVADSHETLESGLQLVLTP